MLVACERNRVQVLSLSLTLPYPTLPYLTLPYPTLPYPTLPYLAHPTLPYLTIPYLTLPCVQVLSLSGECLEVLEVPQAIDLWSACNLHGRIVLVDKGGHCLHVLVPVYRSMASPHNSSSSNLS